MTCPERYRIRLPDLTPIVRILILGFLAFLPALQWQFAHQTQVGSGIYRFRLVQFPEELPGHVICGIVGRADAPHSQDSNLMIGNDVGFQPEQVRQFQNT